MFAPFTDDTLAELDTAHDDIRKVRGETPPFKSWRPDYVPEVPWELVFRKPTVGEAESFEGRAHNERAKPSALRDFAKTLIVGVSLDGKQTICIDRRDAKDVRLAWDALRAKYPNVHISEGVQDALSSLSGQTSAEGGKD